MRMRKDKRRTQIFKRVRMRRMMAYMEFILRRIRIRIISADYYQEDGDDDYDAADYDDSDGMWS